MRRVAQASQVTRGMGIFRHAGTTLGLSVLSSISGFVASWRRLHFRRAGRKEWRNVERCGLFWSMGFLSQLPRRAAHRPMDGAVARVARLATHLTGLYTLCLPR